MDMGNEALEVFMNMIAEGVEPDGLSFAAVLSVCSHVGLVDEDRGFFSATTQDCGIKPDVTHYSCMVDLLGRAGHLEKAKLFIDSMALKLDTSTCGALLGACRNFGNVNLLRKSL